MTVAADHYQTTRHWTDVTVEGECSHGLRELASVAEAEYAISRVYRARREGLQAPIVMVACEAEEYTEAASFLQRRLDHVLRPWLLSLQLQLSPGLS